MNAHTHTHETYVQEVRRLAIERGLESGQIQPEEAAKLAAVKLVYGTGYRAGYRGATFFGTWANGTDTPTDTIEIAAFAEESWLQLAGTTIHEMAHALAGHGSGHNDTWKGLCSRLGLRRAKAAGMRYSLAALDPVLRARVYALAQSLTDGSPQASQGGDGTGLAGFLGILGGATGRPCSAGIGTRGGKSRGVGSGSRLLKVACETCGMVARVTSKYINGEQGAPYCGIVEHGRMEVCA